MTVSLSLPVLALIVLSGVVIAIAAHNQPRASGSNNYGSGALIGCFFYLIAAVVVLSLWLIWALLK